MAITFTSFVGLKEESVKAVDETLNNIKIVFLFLFVLNEIIKLLLRFVLPLKENLFQYLQYY